MFHSVFQAGLSLYFYLSHLSGFFFFPLVFSLRDFWQIKHIGFPRGLVVKNLPANTGDPLEEGVATQSSTLAWKIPCAEESGGL